MSSIELKLYNSRTKYTEKFIHNLDIPINIYTCGPTVYDRVHIGNLKTFLWSDFIICYLQEIGYKTNHIINITDIDDKIINKIEKQNIECLLNFTQYYTDLFLQDIENIGIRSYTKNNIHKVTDNIKPIVEMIKKLLDTDYAYRITNGDIYFDTSKIKKYPFPDYQIERLNSQEEYFSDRTILRSEEIKSKNDFVLWKNKKKDKIYWKTEIGEGCVSWNTECTGIFLKHLGNVDINFGGCDLTFPHHTNSIILAESVRPNGLYGKYSLHSGFLNFSDVKMSKSLGNTLKLIDIKQNYFLLRWYFLSKSYRMTFEFSNEELEKCKTDFINLHLLYNKLILGFQRDNIKNNHPLTDTMIYNELLNIIANDFNTKDALKILSKYVNKMLKVYMDKETAENVLNELKKVNQLFNLLDKKLLYVENSILDFINERDELIKKKQFQITDIMRKELQEKYIFEDEKTGYLIINKIN